MVDGKKYSYTPKGKAAAAKAAAAKTKKRPNMKPRATNKAATPKNRRTKTIVGRRGR